MQPNKKQYKHLIIGFGKGGKTFAAYPAKHGEDVAIIDLKLYKQTQLLK